MSKEYIYPLPAYLTAQNILQGNFLLFLIKMHDRYDRDVSILFTIDTEPVTVRFVDNTPSVDGNTVTVAFAVGAGVQTLMCSVTTQPTQDCEYLTRTLVILISNWHNMTTVLMTAVSHLRL